MVATKEMTVKNPSFMLDQGAVGVPPSQHIRELFQNSVDACQRNPGAKGEIALGMSDIDLNRALGLREDFGPKLMVADSGDGMTGAQLEEYLNQLSSSGSEQSSQGHYGMGSKLTALKQSPYGVVYMSWQNGEGNMIWLHRDPETGRYGMRELGRAGNGHPTFVKGVPRSFRPDMIKGHGTVVVLLGQSPEDNTMLPPKDLKQSTRWITHFLNSKYFSLPEGISIRTMEGSFNEDSQIRMREISGQKELLDQNSESSGMVDLKNATAHWWILKEDTASRSPLWASSGHTAALYQNELYEVVHGRERLQNFGVTFGYQRVVVYIEPHADLSNKLTTDIKRSELNFGGAKLPWAMWADEFEDKMPLEIRSLVETMDHRSTSADYNERLHERLRSLLGNSWLKEKKPKATPGPHGGGNGNGGPHGGAKPKPTKIDPSGLFMPDGGFNGNLQLPTVHWLSIEDGSRKAGDDMENAVGHYVVRENQLHMNANHRLFQEQVEAACSDYKRTKSTTSAAQYALRDWYGLAAAYTVARVKQDMKDGRDWKGKTIGQILTEDAIKIGTMESIPGLQTEIARTVKKLVGNSKHLIKATHGS